VHDTQGQAEENIQREYPYYNRQEGGDILDLKVRTIRQASNCLCNQEEEGRSIAFHQYYIRRLVVVGLDRQRNLRLSKLLPKEQRISEFLLTCSFLCC